LFTISRRLARRLRAVFRRALRWPPRGPCPSVVATMTDHSLRIGARHKETIITFEQEGDFRPGELVFPLELLADCEAARVDLVTFEATGEGTVSAHWQESGIERSARRDLHSISQTADWPQLPGTLHANPGRLITALRNAEEAVDAQSSRFALGHIQLCGQSGQVVSTDGHQLLIQSGFEFPWSENLLIPPNRVWGHTELASAARVLVGQVDGWVTLRAAPWTLQLKVLEEGRFPRTESVVPLPASAAARCRLSPAELLRLGEALKSLPGAGDPSSAVTIDLNGHFAVRATSTALPDPEEVRLARGKPQGQAMRIASRRQYLERAARLGLREFYLFSPESPLLAESKHDRLVWMPLDPSVIVPPREVVAVTARRMAA